MAELDLDELCTICANAMASDRTDRETILITGIAGLLSRLTALEQIERERDELVSAVNGSTLLFERNNYKAGYEAAAKLLNELTSALAVAAARIEVLTTALEQYADRGNWLGDEKGYAVEWHGETDHGYEIARAALAPVGEVSDET